MKKHALVLACLTSLSVGLIGCSLDSEDASVSPSAGVTTGDTILLTNNGLLASINRAAPATVISARAITGMRTGDALVGIDYRPKDGKLYGVGYLGNIYTLNPSTGVASFVASLVADATDSTNPFTKLTGQAELISINFNPVADRLRVIGNDGQNLRINVDTGATITDGTINAVDKPEVIAAAYTNGFNGTANTRLYSIDQDFDRVYVQDPNTGTLGIQGSLGVDTEGSGGFDIDPISNKGYAALKVGGAYRLYELNLSRVGTDEKVISKTTALDDNFKTSGIRGLALKRSSDAAARVYGLAANNTLMSFAISAPNTVTAVSLTGLASNESLVGIDYRLRTTTDNSGVLYGLSNLGNLYTIDITSSKASLVTALTADTSDTTEPYTGLVGTRFVVDFNPKADRLRVISNQGQNLRVNVDTGATTTDGALNGTENPVMVAGAYSNSFQGPVDLATSLFGLEQTQSNLVQFSDPNAGTFSVIGALGMGLGSYQAMDVAGGDNGLVLASIASATGASTLYKVNLSTGAMTPAITVDGTASASASQIGSSSTAPLLDMAILLK